MVRYLLVGRQINGVDVLITGRSAMVKFIIQTPRVVVMESFIARLIRVAATGIYYLVGVGLTAIVNVSTRTDNPAVMMRRRREKYMMEHKVAVWVVCLKLMERTANLLQVYITQGVQMVIALKCILAIYPVLPGE